MNMLARSERWQRFVTEMRSTYKSMDTEEKWDIWVVRPIGFVEACVCRRLQIHPNAITIVSIIFGAASGYFFFPGNVGMVLIGALLLFFANTLDSADGQLARMTRQYTMLGRVLDGFAGDVWFFSIYLFMMIRMYTMPIPGTTVDWGWLGIAVVSVCGLIFHSTQSTIADYYRNIHLYFLKGKAGSELDNFIQQREAFRALPWKGNFWWKAFLFFYGNYTRKQEKATPNFQRFYALVRKNYGDDIPQYLRDEFRTASRPLMKYTNILTFNTRAIVLYISMLVGQPWLYFVFESTVLMILYAYMRHRHESMCARFYHKYAAQ